MTTVPSHRPPQPRFGKIYSFHGPKAEKEEVLELLRAEAEKQGVPFHGRVQAPLDDAFVFTEGDVALGKRLDTYPEDMASFMEGKKALQTQQAEQRETQLQAVRRELLAEHVANVDKGDLGALQAGVERYTEAMQTETTRIDEAHAAELKAFTQKMNPSTGMLRALDLMRAQGRTDPDYAMFQSAADIKKYLVKGHFNVATGLRQFHPVVQSLRNFWFMDT